MALEFDRDFDPAWGEAVEVQPGVTRLTARNPGPFTYRGTNTYLIGRETLAVIDPGPDQSDHFDALLRAIGGRPVSHILVSHTHRDHSLLAARLAGLTGAVIAAEGPHRPARPPATGVTNPLDADSDRDFMPDLRLADGAAVEGDGWTLRAVLTPGHAANHAAFALEGTGILFSADHVMGWSTSIVAPPDGSMADYMASLDRLIERGDRLLLPGHGPAVQEPGAFMRELKSHRRMREQAILARLLAGDSRIGEIVGALYRDVDPALHGAAALSVLAHLEDLVARGLVDTDGQPALGGIFNPR
jgi:glyoxylase-like metal-dependent hydrolase (beta-lactamase superfamily II)